MAEPTEPPGAPATAVASPLAVEPTVGEIADLIASAWPAVHSYRATFRTQETVIAGSPVVLPAASAAASPVATIAERTIVDDVLLTGDRHRTELVGGEIRSEIIVAGGIIYLRGVRPSEDLPPPDPNIWIALDPATLPADSPYRELVDDLMKPATPPYAGLSHDERERIAHPAGETLVNGRACITYQVADSTIIGERIDVTISLDTQHLPCSIETRTGSVVATTTYEFNIPLSIEPPL
jgi:hypothetical protein